MVQMSKLDKTVHIFTEIFVVFVGFSAFLPSKLHAFLFLILKKKMVVVPTLCCRQLQKFLSP